MGAPHLLDGDAEPAPHSFVPDIALVGRGPRLFILFLWVFGQTRQRCSDNWIVRAKAAPGSSEIMSWCGARVFWGFGFRV